MKILTGHNVVGSYKETKQRTYLHTALKIGNMISSTHFVALYI